jgi:uncharacterized protein YjbI with pentapeptide repeats
MPKSPFLRISLAVLPVLVFLVLVFTKTNREEKLPDVLDPAPAPLTNPSSLNWEDLNRLALEKYSHQDPQGSIMLFDLLSRNLSEGKGVDLTGVDLKRVLSESTHGETGSSWADFLSQPASPDLSKYWSLEKCKLNSSTHPGLPLKGISFKGASSDTETWQAWASSMYGRGLEGSELASVNLSGLNLKGVSLKFANLAGTGINPYFRDGLAGKFEGANLTGVDFANVQMTGVTLRYADLRKSSLTASQLAEVAKSEGGSGLRGALLPPTNLSGENLHGVVLQFADLGSVEMTKKQIEQISSLWGGMGLHGAKLPKEVNR